MVPPYQFQHVKIADCWPTSEETLWQDAQLITREGYGGPWAPGMPPLIEQPTPQEVAESLAPHGCLQVALLETDPFKGCKEDRVWALHYENPRESFLCRNRQNLIAGLAEALLMYENDRTTLNRTVQEDVPARIKLFMDTFEHLVDVYELLREGKVSLPSKRLTQKQITTARQILTKLTEVPPKSYLRAAKFSPLAQFVTPMVEDMRQAFLHHGPSYQDYGGIAVDTTIAAILIQFGIEKGAPLETVVERLRKRTQRAPKPAQD